MDEIAAADAGMMSEVTIRLGDARDRAFVLDLGRRVAATSISSIRPAPVALAQLAYERLIGFVTSHQHDLLVAFDGERRCGFLILLREMPDEVTATEQAFVAYMAVEPGSRRRGVGAALLSAAEDLARAHGLGILSLMVTEDNVDARRLYERAGLQTERRMLTKAL